MDLSSIFQFRYVIEYFPKVLSRFPITLAIVLASVVIGGIFGFMLALIRVFKVPVLRQLTVLYISFIRGTPILVQLFIVYYGMPILLLAFGIDIVRWDKMFFVIVTYVLNNGAFMAELIRAAIESIPKGQLEAAHSVGLTTAKAYRGIIIPQAFRNATPAFGVRVIGAFQSTSMAFTLGIIDMMGQVQAIGTRTRRVLEGYVDVALIFIVVSFVLEKVFEKINEKITVTK